MTNKLPCPTEESRALAAVLDKMSDEYAAIEGENYRARKAEYFEKCRALAEKLHCENKIKIYAGDCVFDALFDCIGEDKEHLAAMIMFFTPRRLSDIDSYRTDPSRLHVGQFYF